MRSTRSQPPRANCSANSGGGAGIVRTAMRGGCRSLRAGLPPFAAAREPTLAGASVAGKLRAATLGELMVPIELCRPALHNEVLTPSVVLLTRYGNNPLAVFGTGDDKIAVF